MSGFRQLTNRSYDISDTLYLYIGYDKLLSVGIIFIVPSLVQRFPLSDYWHCRMSSMSSVRPSVCLPHTTAAGLLLWAQLAGDIDQLLHSA